MAHGDTIPAMAAKVAMSSKIQWDSLQRPDLAMGHNSRDGGDWGSVVALLRPGAIALACRLDNIQVSRSRATFSGILAAPDLLDT